MQRGFLDSSGGGSNHKKKEDQNIDGVVRGPRLNPFIADVNVEVVSEAPPHRNTVVVSAQDATKIAMGDVLNQGSNDVNTANVNLDTSIANLNEVTGSTTASQTSTTGIPNLENMWPKTTGVSDVQKRPKMIYYANKLSPSVSTKANLWKMDANVPNDADYDVWLPLASVHEVNDIMKNSFYGYFIGKRLTFFVVEWFVRNNWDIYGLTKVTMVKGFFFFKFSSLEGVDLVLHDGSWMIRGILIFLNKWSPSVKRPWRFQKILFI
ncbi:zinc knuckle CX2CX4HX4C containing protein [Tanacetum coccineum]